MPAGVTSHARVTDAPLQLKVPLLLVPPLRPVCCCLCLFAGGVHAKPQHEPSVPPHGSGSSSSIRNADWHAAEQGIPAASAAASPFAGAYGPPTPYPSMDELSGGFGSITAIGATHHPVVVAADEVEAGLGASAGGEGYARAATAAGGDAGRGNSGSAGPVPMAISLNPSTGLPQAPTNAMVEAAMDEDFVMEDDQSPYTRDQRVASDPVRGVGFSGGVYHRGAAKPQQQEVVVGSAPGAGVNKGGVAVGGRRDMGRQGGTDQSREGQGQRERQFVKGDLLGKLRTLFKE